jgi:hypothetical protein
MEVCALSRRLHLSRGAILLREDRRKIYRKNRDGKAYFASLRMTVLGAL